MESFCAAAQISSDLKRLFDHWGILYSDKDIVVDRRLAMQVAIGEPPQQRLIDYPLWLSLHAEDLQTEDAIIASLDKNQSGKRRAPARAQGARSVFPPDPQKVLKIPWSSQKKQF